MKHRNVLLLLGGAAYQRLSGIARYAHEHEWYVTLDEISELPHNWSGDGVLVTLRNNQPKLRDFIVKTMERNIPIVDYSICHPELRLHRVIGDHVAIGQLAAEHFRTRRFKHVAFFSSESSHVVDIRYGSFARAWGDNPPRWNWRKAARKSEFGNHAALISWLVTQLKSAPKPLAVFAFKDSDAARILNACLAIGLNVPEEVSILGVDDFQVITENQAIPLSSIRHNIEQTGYKGAELLDRLMDGHDVPLTPILVPPSGIAERRSTQTLAVSDETVKRALSLLTENIARPYGIDQLISEMGIKPHVLRSLFEKHLGTTPIKEFTRLRMARAKLLLANTTLPIKTIASEVGYCNIGYFSNSFSESVGVSPSAYRTALPAWVKL